jgi:serine/threonine protein kinase
MDPLQPQDPIELGDWKIIARLASSVNSNIYLGHKGIEGLEQAAIKVLSEEISGDLNAVDRLKVEAEALKKINNSYIAKLVDYNFESNPAWIATEYIDRKTLDAKLKQDGKPITGQEWWQLAAKIFNGLKAIHSEKIIHKDIKPANIIISGEQVKIIDFGISYVPGNTGKVDFSAIQFEGSRPFAAPENFSPNASVSEKMDVFSAAVTLAYSGRLRSIWNDENEGTLRHSIHKEKPDLSDLEPEQIELLEPLLDKFPSKRPSSEEAFNKIAQYIEYLVGKSEGKPKPLKGSSFTYRVLRQKKFQLALVTILFLIAAFFILNKEANTIYIANPNPTVVVTKTPTAVSTESKSGIESSAVDCENEYRNKGKNIINLCMKTAKSGDLASIFYIGKEYYKNQNFIESEKWFLIGAKRNDINSTRGLIETYKETNNEIERNKWAKICADTIYGSTDTSPLKDIAYCKLIHGLVLDRKGSLSEAILYLTDAANYGEPGAAAWLGLYYKGNDKKDLAIKWLEKSAKLGSPDGLNALISYALDLNDEKLAIQWLTYSANENNPRSMGILALTLYAEKKYEDSRKWAIRGSDYGDSVSMYILGKILYDIDEDKSLGKSWIVKSANKGDVSAINKLGEILRIDENNLPEALVWYKKSAARDDLEGMYFSSVLQFINTDFIDMCKYSEAIIKESDKLKFKNQYYANSYDKFLQYALDNRKNVCKVS